MFVGDSLASCLAIYAWHSADWSSIDADWTISPFLLYLSNNYPIKCHLPNHIYMHLHPCCSNHIHSYDSTIFLLVDPFLRYLDPDFSIGLHLNSTFLFFSAKKWFQGVRPRQMGRLGLGMRLWGWWLVTGDWWIWESKCLEFRQVNARTTCKGWSNVVHLAANDPMSLGSLKFAAMLSGIGKLSTLAGRNWSRRTYEP